MIDMDLTTACSGRRVAAPLMRSVRHRRASQENITGAHMKALGVHLLAVFSVVIGGGSLLLFFYFLLFGTPLPPSGNRSDAARLVFDAVLCLVFFAQHSGMIRRGFKQRLAKRIPSAYHPALYSIASGVCLLALVLAWQPTTDFLFHLRGSARWLTATVACVAIAGFAWGIHSLREFDPFGRLPLKATLSGSTTLSLAFVARGPYRYVRHPLYLAMLLLIWSTPRFTTDQLLFNVVWTAWIIIGTKLEERDLLDDFGHTYRQYHSSVPMLIPSLRAVLRQCQSRSVQRDER
jgi:protein-S-isoprenylcysteine O-methyltransferase Ste14